MTNGLICPFCDNRIKIADGSTVQANLRFHYLICNHCGGGILQPQPGKELQSLYQSPGYFRKLSSPLSSKFLNWILTISAHKKPSEWVNSTFPIGVLLDVGCGNGEFLTELKTSGWDVYGVDVSAVATRATGKKIGRSRVTTGIFPKIKFVRKFNYVSFWHVLEHLENPGSFLTATHTVLTDQGIVMGEVPNFDSPILKLFKHNYNWMMVPEHRLYFSRQSLTKTLTRAGFRNVAFVFTPRAILNSFLSLNTFLTEIKLPKYVRLLALVVFLTPALGISYVMALIGRGEVLRFTARK